VKNRHVARKVMKVIYCSATAVLSYDFNGTEHSQIALLLNICNLCRKKVTWAASEYARNILEIARQ